MKNSRGKLLLSRETLARLIGGASAGAGVGLSDSGKDCQTSMVSGVPDCCDTYVSNPPRPAVLPKAQ
jgi:hypothetical protein